MAGWKPKTEVEIIAGTPPGGGTDRSARALLKAIEANKLIDVPVKVANIPGAGGQKAWIHIAGRAGDPNVIGINSPSNVTDVLTGNIEAETIRNTPIAILYNEYLVFISRSDSPITSGAEFVKRLAANAAGMVLSLSTSLGNPNHIALAKVIRHAGAPVKAPQIRVFNSARDVVADIVAGQSEVGIITAASAVPELKSGEVRAIGDVVAAAAAWRVRLDVRHGRSRASIASLAPGAAPPAPSASIPSRSGIGRACCRRRSRPSSGKKRRRNSPGPTCIPTAPSSPSIFARNMPR